MAAVNFMFAAVLGVSSFPEIPQVSCVLRDFPSVVCELRIGQCESVFEGALRARGLLSPENGLGVLYVLRTLGNAYGPLLELHGGKIVQWAHHVVWYTAL